MTTSAMAIRRKMLGIALRQTLLARQRTAQDLADLLGYPIEEIEAMERGARDISLPELEALAGYLQVAVGDLIAGQAPAAPTPSSPQARLLQDKLIGASLRKARTEAGVSLSLLAEALGYAEERLQSYERGLASVPVLELERLAAQLGLDFPSLAPLVAPEPEPAPEPQGQAATDPELAAFAGEADNQPYLRLALEISQLPAASQRAIAEALLAAAPAPDEGEEADDGGC